MNKIVDKLKAFFRKPIVMIAEAILIIAMVALLAVAGFNAPGFFEKVTMVAIAAAGSVDSIATLMASIFDKQKKLVGEPEEPEVILEE
jgi:hypothetical protein